MRRWLSALLVCLMMANIVIWPTDAVAEALEHHQDAVQQIAQGAPAEPAPAHTHCQHGCAGHCGHHFQFQASSFSYPLAPPFPASVISAASALSPQHIPTLPFRPPSVV